jgi:transcription termination factor NusB
MKNQSQTTISLVVSYCKDNGIEAVEFDTVFKSVLSKSDEHNIEGEMFAMFKRGEMVVSKDKDDKQLKAYCKNLLATVLKKSKTLNGNITYAPVTKKEKREVVADPTLNAMNALMSIELDEENMAVIEEAIQKRQQEILVEQQQTLLAQIDFSILDADLLAKLGR